MGVFRGILRYRDNSTGLTWSLTSFRNDASFADWFIAANVWNSAFMLVASEDVVPVDFRVSDEDQYRDQTVFGLDSITAQEGAIAGKPTEAASYAQARGQGGFFAQGSSAWKLHGISQTLVSGSDLNMGVLLGPLEAACIAYFKHYRKVATAHFPVINPPVDFDSFLISGMYFRRLGRPFGRPGQSR